MAIALVVIRGVFLAFLLAIPAMSAAETAVPPLKARVTDLTRTLSADQARTLERTLQAFEARKGTQIVVLIVPSTAPESIEQYGIRVAEQWKVGRKSVDDGAILVVAKDDRTLRIEVGYGLEGVLTDATSNRIISEVIVPRFHVGDFYGGLSEGIDRMIRVANGEPLPPPSGGVSSDKTDLRQYVPWLLFIAFLVGGFLRPVLGRVLGALVAGGFLGFLAWIVVGAATVAVLAGLMGFFFTLLGGGLGGILMGGIGGRGNRGRGIGGGFGGGFRGGGGSFGGGGASGRW